MDAKKGRLWPANPSEICPLKVTTPMVENPSETYSAQLAEDLAAGMADQVAKLFYEYTPARSGE